MDIFLHLFSVGVGGYTHSIRYVSILYIIRYTYTLIIHCAD